MPTILIIEDNRMLLENTAEFLEMEGYEAIMAIDGKEGYEKICSSMPDLVICDLLMPEMGGLELMNRMATHDHLKNIPVIIYSAKSEKKEISRILESGAYDYIIKPSDLEDLLASIKKRFKEKGSV